MDKERARRNWGYVAGTALLALALMTPSKPVYSTLEYQLPTPTPITAPFDNNPEIQHRTREGEPEIDFEQLAEIYSEERVVLPVNVVYKVSDINYIPSLGPIKTCEDNYSSASPNIEAKQVCASVGITQTSDLEPSQEMALFLEAGNNQIDGLNTAQNYSKDPHIRFKSETVKVGDSATCDTGAYCLVVANILPDGYLGYVEEVAGPGGFYRDKPGLLPIHVDIHAQNEFKGCPEDTDETPTGELICSGKLVIGNHVVAHEVGHAGGLDHIKDANCDKPVESDIPPSKDDNYFWSCPAETKTAYIDSCQDPGSDSDQKPDPVHNVMGIAHECDEAGVCSSKDFTFTPDQGHLRIDTIYKTFPSMFEEARLSNLDRVEIIQQPDGTTIVVEYKAGSGYQFKIWTQGPNDSEELYTFPSQGPSDASPLGQTTTLTHTNAITDVQTVSIYHRTGPFQVNPTLWGYRYTQKEKYVKNENGDFVLFEESNTQPPFPIEEVAPSNPNACLVVPNIYRNLPIIFNN